MKCPYCGSKNTQGTNVGERIFANVMAFGAGFAGHLFGPAVGVEWERNTNRAVCEYAKYICLNCKREFSERR